MNKTAATDETAVVNESDAVDRAASGDAFPACHDMATAVAHCGKP